MTDTHVPPFWKLDIKRMTPEQRRRLIYLMSLGGAGSDIPSNVIVDKNAVPIVDENGIYIITG